MSVLDPWIGLFNYCLDSLRAASLFACYLGIIGGLICLPFSLYEKWALLQDGALTSQLISRSLLNYAALFLFTFISGGTAYHIKKHFPTGISLKYVVPGALLVFIPLVTLWGYLFSTSWSWFLE